MAGSFPLLERTKGIAYPQVTEAPIDFFQDRMTRASTNSIKSVCASDVTQDIHSKRPNILIDKCESNLWGVHRSDLTGVYIPGICKLVHIGKNFRESTHENGSNSGRRGCLDCWRDRWRRFGFVLDLEWLWFRSFLMELSIKRLEHHVGIWRWRNSIGDDIVQKSVSNMPKRVPDLSPFSSLVRLITLSSPVASDPIYTACIFSHSIFCLTQQLPSQAWRHLRLIHQRHGWFGLGKLSQRLRLPWRHRQNCYRAFQSRSPGCT